MAMKFDKETLIKHRFWITLGVFALLWLISLSVLWANAGTPAADAQKNYTDATTAAQKYQQPKNDSFLPPWNKYGDTFKQHKNEIWKVAFFGDTKDSPKSGEDLWKGQAGMYTWPSDQDHKLQELLQYPDSPFDISQREWYKGTENNPVYRRQFDELYYELKSPPSDKPPDAKSPPGLRPLDAVLFKSKDPNDYYALMKPVDFERSTKAPDVEECWLAQEDFWVKRELLYVVKAALVAAAKMTCVDDQVTDPLDPKYTARHVFRNESWEVTLLFDQGPNGPRVSPDSTVQNIHVSRRDQDLGTPETPSGVWFRAEQGGNWAVGFEGERVPWGQKRTMGSGKYKDGFPFGGDPKNAMALYQIFDASNAPITRVDEIALPKVSHHNANVALVPAKAARYGKKEPAAGEKASPTTAAPGGASPGAGGSAGGPSPMGGGSGGAPALGGIASGAGGSALGPPSGMQMPGGAGGQQAGDMTADKFFDRDRYLFVTDQSRHLPVAVTLTVDQSHLSDVLVAFANSRLRFQTTQVEYRRVPSAGPGAQPGGTGSPGMGPMPGGTGSPGFGPMLGGAGGPRGPGGSPMGSAGGPPPGLGAPPPPPGGTGMPPMPGVGSPTFPNGPSGGQPPEAAAPNHENNNLIEVTIYGIASLYERPR